MRRNGNGNGNKRRVPAPPQTRVGADGKPLDAAQAEAEADRFRLADLRYRNGVASSLEVLDAQRALFASQQALVQTRLALRQNQVLLYKALGGGWELPPGQTDRTGG